MPFRSRRFGYGFVNSKERRAPALVRAQPGR
jgi:hypothetical protein